MLDLDKENLEVLLENPFVAAIYKRTEPYMPEFLTLDPHRGECRELVVCVGELLVCVVNDDGLFS